MEIRIARINSDSFNPFEATEEELIANALDQAGLIKEDTKVNSESARLVCNKFYEKREKYRKSTRLGSILVQKDIISEDQLKKALKHQEDKPERRIGDTLVTLRYCSQNDIEKTLEEQGKSRCSAGFSNRTHATISKISDKIKKFVND